jgi:hypothetical protein
MNIFLSLKRFLVFFSLGWMFFSYSVTWSQETSPIREGPKIMDARVAGIGETVGDLEITLLDGRKKRLSSLAAGRPLVIAIRDVGCPLSKKYGPRLAHIESNLSRQDVRLVYINLNDSETAESMQKEITTYGFGAPYAHNPGGEVGRTLRVTRTTDVFLLSSQRTLLYRGAIDDQYGRGYTLPKPRRHYLLDAVQALLENRPQPIPATTAPG